MTNIRRAARLIEDLKTLGILTNENVLSCFDSTDESITTKMFKELYSLNTFPYYSTSTSIFKLSPLIFVSV